MDTRTLERILSEQADEIAAKSRKNFITRTEESQIDFDSQLAQVVIGVRRSGKSTLCYNALRRAKIKYAYVNFDDEQLVSLKANDLNLVLEALYKVHGKFTHLFIDEIQNIPEWYLFANRLLRADVKLLITGSNAKLLSGELATHLTGRYNPIMLYPFSFADYCNYKNVDTTSITTQATALRRRAFDDYLLQGGFPELLREKNARAYINTLVDSILKRDIEQRFKVSYKATFERLANHLMNVAPTIVSETALRSVFNLGSDHTVKNYISYLQQAFLLLRLPRFSQKSKLRTTAEKLYVVDTSLMNNRQDALAQENLGWRLETMVLVELLRRTKPNCLDVYYFRDHQTECDFLVCDNNRVVQAVQVCFDISNPKTLKREVNGLLTIARRTDCRDLLLITDHQHDDYQHDDYTIKIRPAHDWSTQATL